MRRIFWGFCRNRLLMSPLHYCTFQAVPIFASNLRRYLSSKNDSPTCHVDKMAYRYNFFKPLNKPMVMVHNIPGLFFAKLVL